MGLVRDDTLSPSLCEEDCKSDEATQKSIGYPLDCRVAATLLLTMTEKENHHDSRQSIHQRLNQLDIAT